MTPKQRQSRSVMQNHDIYGAGGKGMGDAALGVFLLLGSIGKVLS